MQVPGLLPIRPKLESYGETADHLLDDPQRQELAVRQQVKRSKICPNSGNTIESMTIVIVEFGSTSTLSEFQFHKTEN
jgi:hypothetical protein